MTIYGKLISLFPISQFLLICWALIAFVLGPSLVGGFLVIAAIYLLPLAAFHLHQAFFPLKAGVTDITSGYNVWYGTHMIQSLLIAMPLFERVLRLIPGAFAFWLRLWGSKVGNNVHWTSHFEVADRSLLDIGDYVVFGYNVRIASHIVTPNSKYGMVVFVKRVCLGSQSFIGAEVGLGPGAIVEEGALVPTNTIVLPRRTVKKEQPEKSREGHTEAAS
ncbi:MAG: hypothetical protein MI867_20010 [Pseudomonadales bacterium]|nr:hypothetical protein [Pseudomonadales bacterium]